MTSYPTPRSDPAAAEAIPVSTMNRLVGQGHALPIMDGYVIPTFYAGRWWWVPEAGADTETYVPAPAELSGQFVELRQQWQASGGIGAEQS